MRTPTIDMFLDASGYTGLTRAFQRGFLKRTWADLTVEEQWQRIICASLNRRYQRGTQGH